MNNYPNILSVKMNNETIEKLDEVCDAEEQTRSGIVRKAIKSYLRSPQVAKNLKDNDPVDFMM
jgi:metal-responsive CopG/Arc/MetJ family transcriptional regulator